MSNKFSFFKFCRWRSVSMLVSSCLWFSWYGYMLNDTFLKNYKINTGRVSISYEIFVNCGSFIILEIFKNALPLGNKTFPNSNAFLNVSKIMIQQQLTINIWGGATCKIINGLNPFHHFHKKLPIRRFWTANTGESPILLSEIKFLVFISQWQYVFKDF